MKQARVVALLGAESTGKTELVARMAQTLREQGHEVHVVPEVLREFCEQLGRTPMAHEQMDIAREQTRRIELAARQPGIVLADTTALMIAVYSDYIFQDRSLYPLAIEAHQQADLTLLTALDLPWQADGFVRDGAHVREPVDGLIRQALLNAALPFSVVRGQGDARLANAMSIWAHADVVEAVEAGRVSRKPWRWLCEKCDDADCEQHWLPRG